MLQGMQSEIGKLLRLGMGVDSDHTALITKFVGNQHLALSQFKIARVGTDAFVRPAGQSPASSIRSGNTCLRPQRPLQRAFVSVPQPGHADPKPEVTTPPELH